MQVDMIFLIILKVVKFHPKHKEEKQLKSVIVIEFVILKRQ